jgi:hypothetical protein
MSLLTLREPDGWVGSRRLLVWLTAGTLIIFLPLIIWGVVVLVRGEVVTAVALLGIVGYPITTIVSLWFVALGRTTLAASHDSAGTMLLPDRAYATFFYVGGVATIIGGTLYVIYAPQGELALPMSRGWQIFSPILMGVGVLVAVLGLICARRRGGIWYVELSDSGVDIANLVSSKSVLWEDVVDVKDTAESRRTRRAVVLILDDGAEQVIDGTDIYVPHGAGLYWMVRQYWLHPDQRAELMDGRAVERLRAGRFDSA